MYFITSTYGKVATFDESTGNLRVTRAVTLDEKMTLIRGSLGSTRWLIANLTQLIIINPSVDPITQSDIKRYISKYKMGEANSLEFSLIKSSIILNREDFNIKHDAQNLKEILDSLNTSGIEKIVQDKKVMFTTTDLDPILIKILQTLKNRIGFRMAFNVEPLKEKWLFPIRDVDDYLEFAKSCIQNSEEFCFYSKNLYSAFDFNLSGRKSSDQPGAVIDEFIKGKITRLLIQADDEYITKAVAIELQSKIGKLHEYDCSRGDYEMIPDKTGYIFYNCNLLPAEHLYSLVYELQKSVGKQLPIVLFSKEKINHIIDPCVASAVFPSLKKDSEAKLKLCLTLLLKNERHQEKITVNTQYFTLINSLGSGHEINRFIVENNINLEYMRYMDFWYELREKYNPVIKYRFEQIQTDKGHFWNISGDLIEEAFPVKYYPNKCLMYIAYLVKNPGEISSIDLVKAVDRWAANISNKVFLKKTHRAETKETKKSSSAKNGYLYQGNSKTPLEEAANKINETFAYFFGLKKNRSAAKNPPEAKCLEFLYTKGYITIGSTCRYDSKNKIHIEIKDSYIDQI